MSEPFLTPDNVVQLVSFAFLFFGVETVQAKKSLLFVMGTLGIYRFYVYTGLGEMIDEVLGVHIFTADPLKDRTDRTRAPFNKPLPPDTSKPVPPKLKLPPTTPPPDLGGLDEWLLNPTPEAETFLKTVLTDKEWWNDFSYEVRRQYPDDPHAPFRIYQRARTDLLPKWNRRPVFPGFDIPDWVGFSEGSQSTPLASAFKAHVKMYATFQEFDAAAGEPDFSWYQIGWIEGFLKVVFNI